MSFRGKSVLITGGGKGIGRETARLFAEEGAKLFITGRDLVALEATAADLGSSKAAVFPLEADVREQQECRKTIDYVREKAGRLDVLINNAGMSMRGRFEELDPQLIRTMMEINYLGSAYTAYYALPLLKEAKGSIVFISSLSALRGLPFIGPYGASKRALQGLAQSMRFELGKDGVHVGILHVGFTENDPNKKIYAKDGSLVPLQRSRNSSTQRDVARAVLRCVKKRRKEMVLTPAGHTADILYRFFPRLSDFLISRFADRSGRYS